MLEGDFDSFASSFHLPHFISSADNKTVLKTRAEMRSLFDMVLEDYRRRQITDLVRFCDLAEYRSETRLMASHTTHMMSGNHRVAGPFPAYSVLELMDGRWLMTSSQYAVDASMAVGRALRLHTQKTDTDEHKIRNPK